MSSTLLVFTALLAEMKFLPPPLFVLLLKRLLRLLAFFSRVPSCVEVTSMFWTRETGESKFFFFWSASLLWVRSFWTGVDW